MKSLEAEIGILESELAVGFLNRVRKDRQDAHDQVDVAAVIIATKQATTSVNCIVATLNAAKREVKLTLKDLKARKADGEADQQTRKS